MAGVSVFCLGEYADTERVDTAEIVEVNPAAMVDENDKPIDYKKARELKRWFSKNLAGKTVVIESDGRIQKFTSGGLKASLKKIRYPQHNEMYAELATLISKATYDRTIEADKKHADVLAGQRVYFATARIGTSLYSVEIRLDIPLNEPDILHYKDHSVTEKNSAPRRRYCN